MQAGNVRNEVDKAICVLKVQVVFFKTLVAFVLSQLVMTFRSSF